ncbi:MAG: hypothetical protein H6737_25205 [Alphaproteobacteria bacterium]|nr:hypothetical protein [Alphaproteobacteria bacterium]
MLALLLCAFAADFAVLSAEEELRPGLPGTVWVAVLDGSVRPPAVEIVGGTVRFGLEGARDGVWPLVVTPEVEAEHVELKLSAGGRSSTVALDVGWPQPGDLDVPARVEAVVQGEVVRIPVTGANMPPPELLQVVVAEGAVVGVEAVEGGLEILVETGDSPFPRLIPFGVRDARTDARPSWGAIRLRAKPRIPLDAEPGAKLRLEVGGRTYGPFEAGRDGRIVARVDQYPGENLANAIFIDDLGNQTVSTIPLATESKPSLVAIPGERASLQGRPRLVYLRATDGEGHAWRDEAPTCRSPAVGSLDVLRINAGLYAVPVEGRFSGDLVDVRLECRLGAEASASLRLGPPEGVATRLLLQVWPTDLSTDLPVAEVRAAVEDARGQRLDPSAIVLRADHGAIERSPGSAETGEAEYRGESAVDVGRDTIHARYEPASSLGPVARLDIGWDRTGAGFLVYARALDAVGAPVRDAVVRFDLDGEAREAKTNLDGWAAIREDFVEPGPLVVNARTGVRKARALVLPGTRGPVALGAPLLETARDLTLSPGRVAGISVLVDPPILRTGRASVAWVSVQLEDRAGNPLTEEDVQLEVSEGSVGPLIARPDGTWVAEYVPEESDRPREVTITAKTESLRSTARLTLEPRLGRLSLGPQVGWISNFGSVSSPVVTMDADLRTRLLAESVLVRASVSGYRLSANAETGLGDDAQLVGGVFPLSLAVLLRQDRGGVSFWGGAGGSLGLHTVTTRFGNRIVSRGNRVVSGGTLIAGAGYRLGLGDLVAELRWSSLPGPGGEVGFTGNLGGLAIGVGFRLVY